MGPGSLRRSFVVCVATVLFPRLAPARGPVAIGEVSRGVTRAGVDDESFLRARVRGRAPRGLDLAGCRAASGSSSRSRWSASTRSPSRARPTRRVKSAPRCATRRGGRCSRSWKEKPAPRASGAPATVERPGAPRGPSRGARAHPRSAPPLISSRSACELNRCRAGNPGRAPWPRACSISSAR